MSLTDQWLEKYVYNIWNKGQKQDYACCVSIIIGQAEFSNNSSQLN